MSSFDISKVKKLTREDYISPKITLERIKQMYGYLDEENPATYELFLKYRPDLTSQEVAYYRDIIETLHENTRIRKEMIAARGMLSYDEFVARLEPPKLIREKVE